MKDLLHNASWAADMLDALQKEHGLDLSHGVMGLRTSLREYDRYDASSLNVRLSTKTKRRVCELASRRAVSTSEMTRHLIDIAVMLVDVSTSQYKDVKDILENYTNGVENNESIQ